MSVRFPKVCRQVRSNNTVSLFVNIRVSPYGSPKKYERRYIGVEGSVEAVRNLAELQDEFARNNGFIKPRQKKSDKPSIARLCSEFLDSVREEFPPPSRESEHCFYSLAPLVEYCGEMTTDSFNLNRAEELRMAMIRKGNCCRNEINSRVRRIIKCFKWGARRGLVPVSIVSELVLLEPIKVGRFGARDNQPVKPVPIQDVLATLPFLSTAVSSMVKIQLFTGARPGEVCIMRVCDIDTQERNGCWRYYPEHDKTQRFRPVGDKKCIPLNVHAQEVLKPFLRVKSGNDYLFSPIDAVDEKCRKACLARGIESKTSATNKKNFFKPYYAPNSYRACVSEGARRAGVKHWFPYQLRHTAATEINKALGIEAAQIILGHSSANTTAIYVERDNSLAEKIASSLTMFDVNQL